MCMAVTWTIYIIEAPHKYGLNCSNVFEEDL